MSTNTFSNFDKFICTVIQITIMFHACVPVPSAMKTAAGEDRGDLREVQKIRFLLSKLHFKDLYPAFKRTD